MRESHAQKIHYVARRHMQTRGKDSRTIGRVFDFRSKQSTKTNIRKKMPQFANAGEKKTHDRKRCAVRLRQSYPFCPLRVRPLKLFGNRLSVCEPTRSTDHCTDSSKCCDEVGPRSPFPVPTWARNPKRNRSLVGQGQRGKASIFFFSFFCFSPVFRTSKPSCVAITPPSKTAGRDEGREKGIGNAGGGLREC